MKTQPFFGLLLLAIISTIYSCVHNGENARMQSNAFELSTNSANLSASNDSIVITTKGKLWWINDILINGNYLIFDPNETEKQSFEIEGDWFSIEKCDNQKLIVRVDENKSPTQRNIKITLEAGDYSDHIDLNQLARK